MSTTFDKWELNKIIHSLRKDATHIFGGCGKIFNNGVNEARLIAPTTLLPKNSASLTDVVLSQAQMGLDKDARKFNVAIKMWFGWDAVSDTVAKTFYDYCKSLPGNCSDKERLSILNSMILPEFKRGKTAADLFYDSVNEIRLPENTVSLTYEARMYSYITENIIMRNVSPNFVPLFSASSCAVSEMRSIFKKNPFSGSDRIVKKLELIEKLFGNKVAMNFIITGSGNNMVKLADFITKNTASVEDAGVIIFQALYALYIMDQYNIFHGDLHGNNLFVQILDKPIDLYFNINGNKAGFRTKYIFKIYDFDRAYSGLLGENKRSQYNSMRRNADFAQFLCGCVSNERDNVYKPFTEVLIRVGLRDIAELEYMAIPKISKHMGKCNIFSTELSSDSSENIIKWLKSSALKNALPGQFRIKPSELSKLITPSEFNIFRTVFDDRYLGIVKNLLVRYTRKLGDIITLYVCQQWFCSTQNDINIDITKAFEPSSPMFSRIIHGIEGPVDPDSKTTIHYTFIPPSMHETAPSLYLNKLYNQVGKRVLPQPHISQPKSDITLAELRCPWFSCVNTEPVDGNGFEIKSFPENHFLFRSGHEDEKFIKPNWYYDEEGAMIYDNEAEVCRRYIVKRKLLLLDMSKPNNFKIMLNSPLLTDSEKHVVSTVTGINASPKIEKNRKTLKNYINKADKLLFAPAGFLNEEDERKGDYINSRFARIVCKFGLDGWIVTKLTIIDGTYGDDFVQEVLLCNPEDVLIKTDVGCALYNDVV